MIAIVDYGLGNLRSICAALERLQVPCQRTADHKVIRNSRGLIIPGVGAFPDGMKNLADRGLTALLSELVLTKERPVLGICLGFQLMAQIGNEFRRGAGLGWLDAEVVRLDPGPGFRIPHMGWNECVQQSDSPLFTGVPQNSLFYFTHSYHVKCAEETAVIGECEYGGRFVAAIQKGNIFGTQFHPEKSQSVGLAVLRNFADIVAAC